MFKCMHAVGRVGHRPISLLTGLPGGFSLEVVLFQRGRSFPSCFGSSRLFCERCCFLRWGVCWRCCGHLEGTSGVIPDLSQPGFYSPMRAWVPFDPSPLYYLHWLYWCVSSLLLFRGQLHLSLSFNIAVVISTSHRGVIAEPSNTTISKSREFKAHVVITKQSLPSVSRFQLIGYIWYNVIKKNWKQTNHEYRK